MPYNLENINYDEKRPIKFSLSRNSSTTRGCTELCAHKGLVHAKIRKHQSCC